MARSERFSIYMIACLVILGLGCIGVNTRDLSYDSEDSIYAGELYRLVNVRDALIHIDPEIKNVSQKIHVGSSCRGVLERIQKDLREPISVPGLTYVEVSRRLDAAMKQYIIGIQELEKYIGETEKNFELIQEKLRDRLDKIIQAANMISQLRQLIPNQSFSDRPVHRYEQAAQDLFKMISCKQLCNQDSIDGGCDVPVNFGYYDVEQDKQKRSKEIWGKIYQRFKEAIDLVTSNYVEIKKILEPYTQNLPTLPNGFTNVTGAMCAIAKELNGKETPFLTQINVRANDPEPYSNRYKQAIYAITMVMLEGIESLLQVLCDQDTVIMHSKHELPLGSPIALSGAYESSGEADRVSKGTRGSLGRLDYNDGGWIEWNYSTEGSKEWVKDVQSFGCPQDADLKPKPDNAGIYYLWQSTFDISKTSEPCHVLYTTDFGPRSQIGFDSKSNPVLKFMQERMSAKSKDPSISGSLLSRLDPTDPADRVYFLDKRPDQARVCAVDGLAKYDGHCELNHFCGPIIDSCSHVTGTFANCAKKRGAIAVALSNGAIAFVCSYSLRPLPYMIAPRCLYCRSGPAMPILIRWCCNSNTLVVLYEHPKTKKTFINIYVLPCDRPQDLAADIEAPSATIRLPNIVTFVLCCGSKEHNSNADPMLIYVLTNPCKHDSKSHACRKGLSMVYSYSWSILPLKLSSCEEQSESSSEECHNHATCEKQSHLRFLAKAQLPCNALFMEPYHAPNFKSQSRCECDIVVYSKLWDKKQDRPAGLLQLVRLIKNPDPV
jgi:hypothetical protein